MVSIRDSFVNILIIILLFMMGIFSTVLMPAKEGLAIFIVLIILITAFFDRDSLLNKSICIWFCIYIFNNLWSLIYGTALGNQDAFSGFNVAVLEPFIFFIIISFINKSVFDKIEKVLRVLLCCICVYNLLYFLVLNHFLPGNPELFVGNYANFGGLSIGFTKIHSNNIPWLIMLVPMHLCSIFLSEKNKKGDYIILFLGIINAIVSLRTAFLIVIVISPILCIIFSAISKVPLNKRSVLIFCLIIVGVFLILLFTSSSLMDTLKGAVDKVSLSFSKTQNGVDSGGYMRIAQGHDLINTWLERPVLGWGASANAKTIIRSEIAGAYEMQYHAMLMQKGLIGFLIYVSLLVWMFVVNIKQIRRRAKYYKFSLCVLVGTLSILIANATNPYLGSFDRLFLLFIPLLTYKMNLESEELINV